MKKVFFGSMIVAALTLSGCGGGGTSASQSGGGGTSGTTASRSGFFIDSAVSGVSYYGDKDSSGITDSTGKFYFKDGERETFKIGKIILGHVDMTSAPNKTVVTPIDLVNGKTKGTYDSSDYSNPKVTKMASFLQSLDKDHDPTNGIDIDTSTAEALDSPDTSEFDMSQKEMDTSEFDDYMKKAGVNSSDYVNTSAAESEFKKDMEDGMKNGSIDMAGDGKHHIKMD